MKNRTIRILRVNQLKSVNGKGHDLFVQKHRVARVGGLGEDNFSYYLYDQSKEDFVVRHILRLAKCRARAANEFVAFSADDSENQLLVA